MVNVKQYSLFLTNLGVKTYRESIVYVREDCNLCTSEGLEVETRVKVTLQGRSIIATIHIVTSTILAHNQASLSEYAWRLLAAKEGDEIFLTHANPVKSLSYVRSKIYANPLAESELVQIITDITHGLYSDIYISSFLTACAGGKMNSEEILGLTKAMINVGDKLHWDPTMIVDKHCVGGLPGNRTTPIVVPIICAYGLTMPKTSSRAITSPAGTADTMEVLTSVNISLNKMREIVAKERGCIIWGGELPLSPADDILIRVERLLNLDSEGQLVASILSKKIAAGATHILIDVPIGDTAKVRTQEMANLLKYYLETTAQKLGVYVKVIFSDGSQPVGRGIGPALEARDIVEVLTLDANAPQDLKERALIIAGEILEFSPTIVKGSGYTIAKDILDSGKAWDKFKSICEAQGGMKKIPQAKYTHIIKSPVAGEVYKIDNRMIALIAKLAGAPTDPMSGIDLHVFLKYKVVLGQPLFTIHANSPGELNYVLNYLEESNKVIFIRE